MTQTPAMSLTSPADPALGDLFARPPVPSRTDRGVDHSPRLGMEAAPHESRLSDEEMMRQACGLRDVPLTVWVRGGEA